MTEYLGQKRTARISGELAEVHPGVAFEGKAELDVYRDSAHGVCVYADWTVTAANRKVRVGNAAPIPLAGILVGSDPFEYAMLQLVKAIEGYELSVSNQGARPFRVAKWEWVQPGPSIIVPGS